MISDMAVFELARHRLKKAAIEAGVVSTKKADEMIYWTLAKQRAYIAATAA